MQHPSLLPTWALVYFEMSIPCCGFQGGDPRDHAASEWKDPMEVTSMLRQETPPSSTNLPCVEDLHPRAADEPAELGSPASLKRCAPRPRRLEGLKPFLGGRPPAGHRTWKWLLSDPGGVRVSEFTQRINVCLCGIRENREHRNWYSWLAQSLNRKKLLQEEAI